MYSTARLIVSHWIVDDKTNQSINFHNPMEVLEPLLGEQVKLTYLNCLKDIDSYMYCSYYCTFADRMDLRPLDKPVDMVID